MNKLLKDAIADAKAVRETAMANAKLALEEAFAPKIQSMLSHKIKEDMEQDPEPMEEDEEEITMSASEDMPTESRWNRGSGLYEDEDEDMPAEEAPAEDAPEAAPEEGSDEGDISDEELAEILRELEGDEEEMMATEGDEYGDEEEMMATEGDDYEEEDEAPKMEARRKKKKMMEDDHEDSKSGEEEEVSIEEIIRALREGDDEGDDDDDESSKAAETEADLEEAYKVIKFLRSKLNEVNLLNAKLLYVNKLFKKANLTESKKMRVIETFDRVKSVREAKLVYATLCESLAAASNKKPIKSGRTSLKEGFASRASRGTQVINESNQLVNRFKELVNYNKNNY